MFKDTGLFKSCMIFLIRVELLCNVMFASGVPQKDCYQFSSVAQSCPTPSDPMDCSLPGLPVHHQLPELAETLVHRVGDDAS